jgi:hypothetical protein
MEDQVLKTMVGRSVESAAISVVKEFQARRISDDSPQLLTALDVMEKICALRNRIKQ